MSRTVLAAAVLLIGLASVLPGSVAHADGTPTTHTWIGADPKDPSNWQMPKNWDDNKTPANYDVVIIDKDVSVTNLPSGRTFTSVSLSNGATLRGTPDDPGELTALNIVLDCGDLQNVHAEPTLLMTVEGGRLYDSPVSIGSAAELLVRHELLGAVGGCSDYPERGGVLELQGTTKLTVDGTVRGDAGVILGGTGVPVLDVTSKGTLGHEDGKLTLNSVTATLQGKVTGTGVRISGSGRETTIVGSDHPNDPAVKQGFRLLPKATLLLAASTPPATGGTARYVASGWPLLGDGAVLTLGSGAELAGTPTFAGKGELELASDHGAPEQPPTIYGTVTTSPETPLAIDGNGPKAVSVLDRKSAAGAGRLVTQGPVELSGRGTVTVSGTIDLKGTLAVPAGAANAPVFRGSGCCTEPVVSVIVERTATIGKSASLTVADMRLALAGSIGGDGRLALAGGSHRFLRGSKLTVSAIVAQGALITLASGDVTLDGTLNLLGDSKLTTSTSQCTHRDRVGPWCPVALDGSGSLEWRGGEISGAITTGKDVTVYAVGSRQRYVREPSSRLAFAGQTTIGGPIQLDAGAHLELDGEATLKAAKLTASSCCTSRAVLEIGPDGVTRVAKSRTSVVTSSLIDVSGVLDLARQRLNASDSEVRVRNHGKLVIRGGHLDTGGAAVSVDRGGVVVR